MEGISHFVTSITAPMASGWSKFAGWDSHPLRNAAFARRTPEKDLPVFTGKVWSTVKVVIPAHNRDRGGQDT